MKKEPCFIIIDKEERVIKKDQNGMLCIFDTDIEANKFLRFLYKFQITIKVLLTIIFNMFNTINIPFLPI